MHRDREYYKEFRKKPKLLKLECYIISQGKSGFFFHIEEVIELSFLCQQMSYITSKKTG